MLLTIFVDLDHLIATPIYNPNRCSIGFHPLHTYPAITSYTIMTAFCKTRLIGMGLLTHMLLDAVDCFCIKLEAKHHNKS